MRHFLIAAGGLHAVMCGAATETGGSCLGVCGSVDRAEARPVVPYQGKYGCPYHTWLGCPQWPFICHT